VRSADSRIYGVGWDGVVDCGATLGGVPLEVGAADRVAALRVGALGCAPDVSSVFGAATDVGGATDFAAEVFAAAAFVADFGADDVGEEELSLRAFVAGGFVAGRFGTAALSIESVGAGRGGDAIAASESASSSFN
jgi:hypothetical protein